MNNHEMVDAMLEGKMRALYVAGEDMISAHSNANTVAAAFGKLDLFVVQDIFFSETCRYADVVLPASRRWRRMERLRIRSGGSSASWSYTNLADYPTFIRSRAASPCLLAWESGGAVVGSRTEEVLSNGFPQNHDPAKISASLIRLQESKLLPCH